MEGFVLATKPAEYLFARNPSIPATTANTQVRWLEISQLHPVCTFSSNASTECSRNICKRYWPPPKPQMAGSQNAGSPVLVPDLNSAGGSQEESG